MRGWWGKDGRVAARWRCGWRRHVAGRHNVGAQPFLRGPLARRAGWAGARGGAAAVARRRRRCAHRRHGSHRCRARRVACRAFGGMVGTLERTSPLCPWRASFRAAGRAHAQRRLAAGATRARSPPAARRWRCKTLPGVAGAGEPPLPGSPSLARRANLRLRTDLCKRRLLRRVRRDSIYVGTPSLPQQPLRSPMSARHYQLPHANCRGARYLCPSLTSDPQTGAVWLALLASSPRQALALALTRCSKAGRREAAIRGGRAQGRAHGPLFASGA